MTRTRCERIRAWLASQTRPASARDVLEAVDPLGDINVIAASLAAMAKAGLVEGTKLGHRRYYVIGRAPKPRAGGTRKAVTGRADRIRALLQQNDRGYTAAEVRDAVDPSSTQTRVSASMHSLAQQGHIHRATHPQVLCNCYGRTPALAAQRLELELQRLVDSKLPQSPTPARQRATKPKATSPAKRATSKQPTAPPARPVHRGLPPPPPPPPSAAMRAAMDNSARPTSRPRPAPLTCALDSVPQQQQLASERIAADIAAFERGGGRIEKLGTTQLFKHIGREAANHVPPRMPRMPRTGTFDLDD